jgi:hypothetical protein
MLQNTRNFDIGGFTPSVQKPRPDFIHMATSKLRHRHPQAKKQIQGVRK